jgi:hypothetical protein
MITEDNLRESNFNSWRKFYNPGREEVLKLNLYSPEQKKKKKTEKKTTGTDLVILHHSIERVKKFLPGVKNLMLTSSKDEKQENIIYQRLEHIEEENNLKEEINQLNNIINEYKEIRNLKDEELIKLISEINDIELDINMMSDVSRYTMIDKERNDLLKEVQIHKENMKMLKKKEREKEKLLKLENKNNVNTDVNNKNNEDKTLSNFNEEENFKTTFFKNTKIKIEGEQQLELMFLRASESRSKKLKELKSKLPPLIKSKNEIMKEIKEINEKIEKIREKKNLKSDELYYHYLSILKEGTDTRSEGLSWIIKEIYILGKEIMISYLPDFLDELCIVFIFKQAKINLELNKLENKIEKTRLELKNIGLKNINNKNLNNPFFTSENKEKLNFDTYDQFKLRRDQNAVNAKITNLSNSNLIPPVLKLRDVQEIVKKSEIHISQNQMERLIKYFSLCKRRDEIKEFQDKLKKKEMNRIFEEYLKNDYFQRFKVEKNVVLSALIGEDNILPELNKQMRETKKYFDNLKSIGMHKRIVTSEHSKNILKMNQILNNNKNKNN